MLPLYLLLPFRLLLLLKPQNLTKEHNFDFCPIGAFSSLIAPASIHWLPAIVTITLLKYTASFSSWSLLENAMKPNAILLILSSSHQPTSSSTPLKAILSIVWCLYNKRAVFFHLGSPEYIPGNYLTLCWERITCEYLRTSPTMG